MSSDLYKAISYTTDIQCLKDCNIYEYDIAKANISVLFDRGLISSFYYNYLYNQDKMVRQVTIGKMEKDNPEITKEKAKGIEEAKKYIFEMNNIDDSEVISIKNDAVFITRPLYHTKYKHAEFTLRNQFNLFIKVFRLEFYYLWDPMNDKEVLNIKGIRDEVLEKQNDYLLDFLKELFSSYITNGVDESIVLLRNFYKHYMNKEFDIGYYRDLYTGKYSLNTGSIVYDYDSDISDSKLLPMINISNNGSLLREIGKILYTDYLR